MASQTSSVVRMPNPVGDEIPGFERSIILHPSQYEGHGSSTTWQASRGLNLDVETAPRSQSSRGWRPQVGRWILLWPGVNQRKYKMLIVRETSQGLSWNHPAKYVIAPRSLPQKYPLSESPNFSPWREKKVIAMVSAPLPKHPSSSCP
jgi:hypothetical protein